MMIDLEKEAKAALEAAIDRSHVKCMECGSSLWGGEFDPASILKALKRVREDAIEHVAEKFDGCSFYDGCSDVGQEIRALKEPQ